MTMMDPLKIIEKYYSTDSRAYYLLVHHSRKVTEKALEVAQKVSHLHPDRKFIEEAAMLHDLGIFLTDEPGLGCYGKTAYLCHGYLGRELLEKEGYPLHGFVCERHVGVGITAGEIRQKNLPLPNRDMIPLSLEEQIVCFADKFFSKDEEFLFIEKPIEKVRQGIAHFGDEKLRIFDDWLEMFGY